ncbi:hypothetical protein RCO27_16505 [Sphingosinicella sp. LHD-64]|uniref:hypothetical protein n=1 Tax=Sphingosinicella sp. LHD-64 TaxID=3072139 RepID=UPI0028101334|nr:hypothetical protein [Sphingosinicella sp. LHD-64]MDQ8757829.1 hypothetical protein [Sphingosinicella sp. LHD-64]
MEPDHKDYYLARAEAELTLGDEATDDRAAWAHFQLAGRYFDLAFGGAEDRGAPAQPMPEQRSAA